MLRYFILLVVLFIGCERDGLTTVVSANTDYGTLIVSNIGPGRWADYTIGLNNLPEVPNLIREDKSIDFKLGTTIIFIRYYNTGNGGTVSQRLRVVTDTLVIWGVIEVRL